MTKIQNAKKVGFWSLTAQSGQKKFFASAILDQFELCISIKFEKINKKMKLNKIKKY